MKYIRNIFIIIIICSLIIAGQASGSGVDLTGSVTGSIHSGPGTPVVSTQTPDIQSIPERNPVSDIPGIVERSPDISLPPLHGDIAGTTGLSEAMMRSFSDTSLSGLFRFPAASS